MSPRARTPRPRRAGTTRSVERIDSEITPKRGETVPFEVLCRPRSGSTLPQVMGELAPDSLENLTPDDRTLQDVSKALLAQGFTVHTEDHGTSVSAEGPYELFERVFQTRLRKRTRTLKF